MPFTFFDPEKPVSKTCGTMLRQVESRKKWPALQIHRAALEGASEAA